MNNYALAYNPSDSFNYRSWTVPYYGLGWYYDTPTSPPSAYLSAFSGLRFFAGGGNRLTINSYGLMGLGVEEPHTKLHLSGDEFITLGNYENTNGTKGIHFTGFRDVKANFFGASIEGTPEWSCCNGYPAAGGYPSIKTIGLNFYIHGNNDQHDAKQLAMAIKSNGNVGIGTDNPNERLAVNGKIRAKEIKVETANWPDYVFKPDYKLPSLKETEAQIKANGHLPGMPSAKDVETNGIELGEMNKLLLKKIEELTLHLIEKEKQLFLYERRLIFIEGLHKR